MTFLSCRSKCSVLSQILPMYFNAKARRREGCNHLVERVLRAIHLQAGGQANKLQVESA